MTNLWRVVTVVLVASCGGGGSDKPPPKTALMTEMESSCTTETKPSHKVTGSCVLRSPAGEYCIDYTGDNDSKSMVDGCMERLHGEFNQGPCKADGIVSRCLVQCGKPTEGISTYYYGDKAELAGKCDASRGTLL